MTLFPFRPTIGRHALVPLLVLLHPGAGEGQERLPADLTDPPGPGDPPVVVTLGERYEASPLRRSVLGSRHRDVWSVAISPPVLDPGSFRGGLTPVRRGGGFQTLTLHMRDSIGRYYLFRSIDKRILPALPPDLRNTPVGSILQDQTSSQHPGAAWVVTSLLEAVDVPSARPRLFLMPDHPFLGEEHRDFAGRTGMLVESPDHGPDGDLRYRGASRVLGSEDWLRELRSGPEHRADSRAVLRARLVDLLVGDPDRGFRQWRWMRYGEPGAWTWRGVPMDRDAAFITGDGLIGVIGRMFTPKFVRFDRGIDLEALVESEPELDRLLLAELDRESWDAEVERVVTTVTDSVIGAAVASMPDGWAAADSSFLAPHLRARRDSLRAVAARYYDLLARRVDVRGTEADEVAIVEFHSGGEVEVSLYGPRADADSTVDDERRGRLGRYFHRRFLQNETEEIRMYLGGGADRAEVRGGPPGIMVRVIGGPGDDELIDRSAPGGVPVAFYDHEGENRIRPAASTRVDRRPWDRSAVTAYRFAEGDSTVRDFGRIASWDVFGDYEDGPGIVLGVKRSRTAWGFRRAPWARKGSLGVSFGTSNGGFGLGGAEARRMEGTSTVISVEAEASRDLGGVRFFGFGNETPEIESDRALVLGDEVRLVTEIGWGTEKDGPSVAVGPRLRYVDIRPSEGVPLQTVSPLGVEGFGQLGVGARATLGLGGGEDGSAGEDRGDEGTSPGARLRLETTAAAYPPVWDAPEWFGRGGMKIDGVVPMGATRLVLRAGGEAALGRYPVHEAAFLGGQRTLRGFRSARFAGDAATWGGVEWRVPLARLTLLTRGDVGILGLADAGRVWFDGESSGGWHTGLGAGIWFRTLGVTASASWARGEEDRLYLRLGTGF